MLGKSSFHQKILLSLGLAFGLGLWANFIQQGAIGSVAWTEWLNQVCEFVGKLFLNALKMVVIPLVVSSIISGVSEISANRDFGRLGLKTLLLYSLTGIIAVIIGLTCVNLIQPGAVDPSAREAIIDARSSQDAPPLEQALENAHTTTGRAIFYTATTIAAGFCILSLSNFFPTVLFGLFTSLAMVLAFITSLTVLPNLLVKYKVFQ